MKLTLNKQSALAVIRYLRSDKSRWRTLDRRTDVEEPDPYPKKRWSKLRLAEIENEMGIPIHLTKKPLDIAVPRASSRIRTQGVTCTVYTEEIPEHSFIKVNRNLSVSGPELLFAELAESMHPIEHLMLGHELCGSFSRDPENPYNGTITYRVKPLTSVSKIARFLDSAKRIRRIDAARATLKLLNDNAWSPTESLITALFRLPIDDLGYDLGPLILNERIDFEHELPGAKDSRVPDIIFANTPVGVNYDGLVHLDLRSIAQAGIELGMHPEQNRAQVVLNQSIGSVRAKAVDDIRRNRELAVDGLRVFPVIKEDLYTYRGLDQVVEQLIALIEQSTHRDMAHQKRILRSRDLSQARHRMMLSFLPGKHDRNVQVGRFIGGLKAYEGPQEVHECWIEL